MSRYICIPSIEVRNANALPLPFIIGFPAITAFEGFAKNLSLRLSAPTHNGIAIVLHEFELAGEVLGANWWERRFYPHQMRAVSYINEDDYAGNGITLSTQPTVRCHMKVSLVISVSDEVILDRDQIFGFLRGGRVAGGSILRHGEIHICNDHLEALKSLPKGGWSVVERQNLMVKNKDDRDLVDTFLRVTRRFYPKKGISKGIWAEGASEGEESLPVEEAEDEASEQNEVIADRKEDSDELFFDWDEDDDLEDEGEPKQPDDSWVQPTSLGYIGVSSLEERTGARESLPHMYVEPLLGLIQFRRTHKAGLCFWRYHFPEKDVFVTTTHKLTKDMT